MNMVSGEAISSKSISLKKASRTLSNFASSDNGASPAFSAYLKRAAASFNELVQLHKESKRLGSEQKVKKRHSTDLASEGSIGFIVNSAGEGLAKEKGIGKKKERQRVIKSEGEAGRFDASVEVEKVGISDGYVVDVVGTGKKSKKNRENDEVVSVKDETYETIAKKKRTHDGRERKKEGNLQTEVANNKESKKRKHESATAQESDGSQEQHKSKKKKR